MKPSLEKAIEESVGIPIEHLREMHASELRDYLKRWECKRIIGWGWLGVAKFKMHLNRNDYWSMWVVFIWRFAFSIHLPTNWIGSPEGLSE